jgi:hypothetical protein
MVRPAAKKEKPALQDAVKKHGSLNKFRQICRFTNLNVEEIAQRGETWRHRVLPVGVFPMSDNQKTPRKTARVNWERFHTELVCITV